MARHLLDTDILIWVLRGKKEAISFLTDLLLNEIPAISTLSIHEIWAGVRPQEEAAVETFLAAFEQVPVNHLIARRGAEYYRNFRSKGMTLSSTDALIAATASMQKLILVTQNRRHFPMSDIELLNI